MTEKQLKITLPIDLWQALRLAFDAGCSYGIASYEHFKQIHEPRDKVVEALERRIIFPKPGKD
jgi:hypothetical protein